MLVQTNEKYAKNRTFVGHHVISQFENWEKKSSIIKCTDKVHSANCLVDPDSLLHKVML